MQRLGLGRVLGAWSGSGAQLSGVRSTAVPTARALATDTHSASSASSAAAAPRVVVLGGGFGGLYAAIRLDQLMWPRGKKPQITLVDQSERFVFKPLLYELINGTASQEEVAPPFAQLLAPYSVRLVQAQVSGVHPAAAPPGSPAASSPPADVDSDISGAAGHVALADGTSLPYDYLLVALGSQPDSRGVAGVRDWAVPFNNLEDAMRVKGTLDLLADSGSGGNVVIVGGGYAGVELAAVVAERLRGRVGPAGVLGSLAEGLGDAAAAAVAAAGVDVGAGASAGGGAGGSSSSSSSPAAAAAVAVQLLTPGSDILEGCPEGQREAANKALAELGVRVVTGARVQALGPPADDPDAALTSLPTACTVTYTLAEPTAPAAASGAPSQPPPPPPQQQRMAADLVIWTAGSSPSTAGRAAREGFPFPTNGRGAVETEPSLRVVGAEAVFALGDVAVAVPPHDPASATPDPHHPHPHQQLPATAQVAFQQADYAAWNIWAAINGRPLLPFRYQHLGSMMSLGQLNAAVSLPFPVPAPLSDALRASPLGPLLAAAGVRLPSDGAASVAGSPGGVTLEGPLAALLRRGAYLYRQPTTEQRLSVATSWLRMGLEAAAAVAGGGRGR